VLGCTEGEYFGVGHGLGGLKFGLSHYAKKYRHAGLDPASSCFDVFRFD